jgi:hypothetical protein
MNIMKKAVFVLAVLLAFYTSFAKSPNGTGTVVMQLATSHEIFYFKACRTMLGATVEVYDPTGKQVATQNLNKRKLIIDFFDMAPGDYKVVVTKNGTGQVFYYHRRDFVNHDIVVASTSGTTLSH